jgi:hypothetical protein
MTISLRTRNPYAAAAAAASYYRPPCGPYPPCYKKPAAK